MIHSDAIYLVDARDAAIGATCDRAHVGCILISPAGAVLGVGYNGAPSWMHDCRQAGCLMIDGHCKRAIHAEARALLNAARNGWNAQGATAYVTHAPCIDCANLLIEAGVVRVVYGTPYGNGVQRLLEAGVVAVWDCGDEESETKNQNERIAAF